MSSKKSLLTKLSESTLIKKLFSNKKRLLLYIFGSGFAILGAVCIFRHFSYLRSTVLHEAHSLKNKIQTMQKNYKKMIILDVVKRQTISSPSGIDFEVVLMSGLQSKPTYKEMNKKADPFHPPFEENQFICELFPSHNLLFNKFSFTRNHLLVTTKEYESQCSLMTFLDFIAVSKAIKAIDGYAFYNSGPHSGYTVDHKHFQVLPLTGLHYGLMDTIKERIKENSLVPSGEEGGFLIKEFRFRHIVRVFEDQNQKTSEKTAEIMLVNYLKALSSLENENGKISYNLIWTQEWMFLALREKKCALGDIGFSALVYSGTLMAKDEGQVDRMVAIKNPIKILEEVSLK